MVRPGGSTLPYLMPAAGTSATSLHSDESGSRGRDDDYSSHRAGRRPRLNSNWSTSGRDASRQRSKSGRRGTVNGETSPPWSPLVDEVLQTIESSWKFMIGEQCVPVLVGLQLMDSSTLGRAHREPEFMQTHSDIQRALKIVVNERSQGFYNTLSTYRQMQANIRESQDRIVSVKTALAEAKEGLLTTRPELKGLAMVSQNYDEILQIFGLIEHIQGIPDRFETRLSEKKFLSAVDILQEGLGLMGRSELEGIGALSDYRTYFSNQKISLTDILIEELHDHLYLKSPYCQDRWKADGGEDGKDDLATFEKPIYNFLLCLDVSSPMTDDASRNPEVDTFHYMHTILEALSRMKSLDVAMGSVEHRLPVELFSVVDKTGIEVTARYPHYPPPMAWRNNRSVRKQPGLDLVRAPVLSEFVTDLYLKFEAIAEGHRVLHDVIRGIEQRDGMVDSHLTGGFGELWKLYQSEIRSLLHDYLATDGEVTFGSRHRKEPEYSINSVQRDKQKKMFKIAEVDQASSRFKEAQKDLDEILRVSVPGLVSKSRQGSNMIDKSRMRQESSGTGHKLLVEPTIFNISIVLPPTLAFIQRLKNIVPPDCPDVHMNTLGSFLEDFLVNVLEPQLEEAECSKELRSALRNKESRKSMLAMQPRMMGLS